MKQYQKMKDSEIDWIGDIPEAWDVNCLKYIAKYELSSVDRHENDGEHDVHVCHYPDVYNNEKILVNTCTSTGTCTSIEFEKFKLKKDDVLITKDSETANDIGVPAYVADELEKTVCGYHLCQISTKKTELLGSYLFRFLQSDKTSKYFEINSHGITRYGLGKYEIGNLVVPCPEISEQKQIAEFLDKETSKLDSQINNNQKLIDLLKEKRQAVINQAVTKGLDPSVPMKDSEIDWIGKIPEHWYETKLKNLCSRIVDGVHKTPDYHDEGVPFISVNNFKNGLLDFSDCKYISLEDHQDLIKRCQPQRGDIILSKVGTLGEVDEIKVNFEFSLFVQLALLKLIRNKLCSKFLKFYLKSKSIQDLIQLYSNQTTLKYIGVESIGTLPIVVPMLDEQKQISEFLDKVTSKLDSLISKTELQTEKLQEYRQALISAAVTGKIDVRQEIVA